MATPPKKTSLLPIFLSGAGKGGSSGRKKGHTGAAAFTNKRRGRSNSESRSPSHGSSSSDSMPDKDAKGSNNDDSKLASCAARCKRRVRSCNMLSFVFALTVLASLYCLVTLGAMVQHNSFTNGAIDSTPQTLFTGWRNNPIMSKLQRLTTYFSSVDGARLNKVATRENLKNIGDYECVGWRQTTNCTPHGEREVANDQNCSTLIANGISGYCEVRNKLTGETKHVMEMHCNSLRPGVFFSCDMFQSLLSYSILSTDYVHDPNFTFEANVQEFRETNKLLDTPVPLDEEGFKNESVGQLELSFERGIVFVIYEKLLLGAYVSVRSLRALGCTLPIEMWYRASETDVDHKLIKIMVAEYGVFLREMVDPRATHFYTKLHAIFYSAFDSVLLLDADNFAVRDPTYLFELPEFVNNGAIFWPDFWRPSNTIFNIHRDSFVWPVFGLEFVDTFEQESGQILINRRKHQDALNVLMYYGFSMPRVPEDLRLVWGDKDLFRFAWMKAQADFYMISRPPGSAGTKHPDYDLFCGVTMVQHDPADNVIFLHRNTEKLTSFNDRFLWTHIQQYKRTSRVSEYFVRGANGGRVFPQFKRCFGKDVHYEKLFTLKPMSAFPFEGLEANLMEYTRDGASILGLKTTEGGWQPKMTKKP